MLFKPRHFPFVSVPSVSSPVICWFGGDAMRMDRVTADDRSDHYWQTQTCRQSSP